MIIIDLKADWLTKWGFQFHRMSLETLLEAAKYVEQQEMRAKQLRVVTAPAPTSPAVASPPSQPVQTVVALQPQQEVTQPTQIQQQAVKQVQGTMRKTFI